jgi:large subunit ribosomal protein L4
MAVGTPKAPVLNASKPGGGKKEVSLEASVFAVDVKPHLVHETVRAELNASRAGTRGTKSRGLVAGGRSKPWRQKGTGRARAGTTRAPHWTGGGVAFAPGMRSFEVKVNRKARRAALCGALSTHARNGTLALVDGAQFDAPSTKKAAQLLADWGQELPVVVVAAEEEEPLVKSFRNLERVLVTVPAELEVAGVVWARSLLVSEAALPHVLARAGSGAGSTEPPASGGAGAVGAEAATGDGQ